ncbi:MAG: ATP synthase F0 subunit B, partial [Bosea sp.]|uniref:ATP synthase F0 subunit B n=1 Tax=Bosea sp. (in: a-proteobacteria) TaxID=1871050 RepID=UPI0031FEAE7B|nr:ATP synthase F0 subunit B [Bosea sp. (in: a-proteobacteria)]
MYETIRRRRLRGGSGGHPKRFSNPASVRMNENRHRGFYATLLGAALWLFGHAAPAFAATHADAGQSQNSIFAGDVGNIVWTVVIFGLVLVVLRVFAWRPLLDNLKKREDFISDSLKKADLKQKKAEENLAASKKELIKVRAEATAIVDEGRRDAEVLHRRIEEEARAEAASMLERARREIGIARESAVKELYDLSGRLAT